MQAHFVPGLADTGSQVDLTGRTKLDVYNKALEDLGKAGLPIHITENNVIAPSDKELRAAQLEGAFRLWWGHPLVEQVGVWSMWNKISGKDEYEPGLWDNDRKLTRHTARWPIDTAANLCS